MSLSDIIVQTPDGEEVRLGAIVERPTIVNVVRYYGCAPCRAQLEELAARHPEITASGGAVIGVGPRAAYQARLLIDRSDIPFPLLLDPDHSIGSAVGQHRQSLLGFVGNVRAWGRWARALRRSGQGMITGGWWETPATVILDSRCRVTWSHLGRSIGDYPPVDDVVAALRDTMGKERASDAG